MACRTFATQIFNFFVWSVFEGCSKVAGISWVSPLELCLIQRRWSLPLLQPHGPPESYTVFVMWEAASLLGQGFQGCRRQTQGLLWVNHTFLTSTRSWILKVFCKYRGICIQYLCTRTKSDKNKENTFSHPENSVSYWCAPRSGLLFMTAESVQLDKKETWLITAAHINSSQRTGFLTLVFSVILKKTQTSSHICSDSVKHAD